MKASEITDSMRRAIHRTPNYQCEFNKGFPAHRCQAKATVKCGNTWFCDTHGDYGAGQPDPVAAERLLRETFRRASTPVLEPQTPVAVPLEQKPGKAPAKARKPIMKRRRVMNRTERAFSERLEAQRLAGEIISWEFEGLALRWGNEETFKYSPDFVVVESVEHVAPVTVNSFPHVRLIFIEIKGSFVWKDDATRFRHARDNFPLYEFQMWAKTKTGWEQTR